MGGPAHNKNDEPVGWSNRRSTMSKARGGLDLALAFVRSSWGGYADRRFFDGVERYCMFVGYPRSGHSLVGSLLDAHPEAVIAHELDALRLVKWGFGRRQLYWLLLENSRGFAREGRRWTGYAYQVPNQWQGRFDRLRVVGDKRGGGSTMRLASDPGLLGRLKKTVGQGIRYVHVVRNPYDNVATMYRRALARDPDTDLASITAGYLLRCETNARLKGHLGENEVLDVHHEAVIDDPKAALGGLCRFLGLQAGEDYLRDCASIVFDSPNKSRHAVEWDRGSLEAIRAATSRFDFLEGYSFKG